MGIEMDKRNEWLDHPCGSVCWIFGITSPSCSYPIDHEGSHQTVIQVIKPKAQFIITWTEG